MSLQIIPPTFGGNASHIMVGATSYGLPPRCATRRIHSGGKHAPLVYVLEQDNTLHALTERGEVPFRAASWMRSCADTSRGRQRRFADGFSEKQDSDNSTPTPAPVSSWLGADPLRAISLLFSPLAFDPGALARLDPPRRGHPHTGPGSHTHTRWKANPNTRAGVAFRRFEKTMAVTALVGLIHETPAVADRTARLDGRICPVWEFDDFACQLDAPTAHREVRRSRR